MGLVDPRFFVGTRCRLSRHKDAKFVNGWVEYFRGESLIVTTEDHMGSETGDKFYVEAYGSKAKACMNAVLRSASAEEGKPFKLSLQLEGHLQVVDNSEASRVLVDQMQAKVTYGGTTFIAKVRDVSIKGVGLVTDSEIAKGAQIALEMDTPVGPVTAQGIVKHVRADHGKFRVGVELQSFTRLDGSRWRKLLGEAA